jgi:uncharacterized FlaG/YvyC family protein
MVAADRPSARAEGVSRAVEAVEAAGLPDQQKPASKEQVEQAVKDIRKVVSAVSSDLQFSVDKDSGRTVVKVVDSKTKEVIRQIPGEEVLALPACTRQDEGRAVQHGSLKENAVATISSAGVGSGLDIENIISNLMTVERQPITQIQKLQTGLKADISAYGRVQGRPFCFAVGHRVTQDPGGVRGGEDQCLRRHGPFGECPQRSRNRKRLGRDQPACSSSTADKVRLPVVERRRRYRNTDPGVGVHTAVRHLRRTRTSRRSPSPSTAAIRHWLAFVMRSTIHKPE